MNSITYRVNSFEIPKTIDKHKILCQVYNKLCLSSWHHGLVASHEGIAKLQILLPSGMEQPLKCPLSKRTSVKEVPGAWYLVLTVTDRGEGK